MIEVDYLGNKPEFIDELSRIWAKEWAIEETPEVIEQKIFRMRKRLSVSKAPFVLVACDSEILVGSAGLSDCDLEKRSQYTPWLIGVYVKPKYRDSGVATKLIDTVVIKAKELGYDKIYLHTEVAQIFYEKLGWKYLEHTTNDQDEKTDVYTLNLS